MQDQPGKQKGWEGGKTKSLDTPPVGVKGENNGGTEKNNNAYMG